MENNQIKPSVTPVPKPRRRLCSRWLFIGCLAVLGVILALPTMLGSKWIYDPLLRRLAKDDFKLEIESVKLRWFSPLVFEGISIRQFEETKSLSPPPLVAVRSIQSNRGLFGYLLNGRNLGRIEINEPKLDIALLEDGSNLERLIKAIDDTHRDSRVDTPQKTKLQPKLDIDIAIRGLSVQVEPPDGGKTIQIVPPFNADVYYRALNQEPEVIVQPAQILDRVVLTQELVRLGLGMAIPLLSKSAWFDGSVSLATQEIHVPLANPVQCHGEAMLTLHQVRSGPTDPLAIGALDALANLRGKEPVHELVFVDGSHVVVKVADERIFHSGLEAGLPRLDERLQIATEGYVGLTDRSLDLKLGIPIPVEQLARREAIQRLGVPRVNLPIGGTLDHPVVKWDIMRGESATLLAVIANRLQNDAPITSTIVDAIGNVTEGQADQAIEAAADLVRKWRERRAQNNASKFNNGEAPQDTSEPEPEKKHPIRDALRKALRGE